MKFPIGRYLTGDGLAAEALADYNVNGNYASDTDFKIIAPSNRIYELRGLTLVINDGGSVAQDVYGDAVILSGTDGLLLQYTYKGVTYDITDGVLIQSNFEWNKLADESIRESADSDILTVKFDFIKQFGVPIYLNPGDEFRVRVKGDLSGLQFHTFFVTGTEEYT